MPSPVTTTGKQLSALVADDDAMMRRLVSVVLKQAGYSGVAVADGSEVMACLAQRHFDVLLMDLTMPVMDGLEALQAIRTAEQRSGRHLPIIMLTGHAEPGDADRLQSAGADGYVAKPINANHLVDELDRVMRTSGKL